VPPRPREPALTRLPANRRGREQRLERDLAEDELVVVDERRRGRGNRADGRRTCSAFLWERTERSANSARYRQGPARGLAARVRARDPGAREARVSSCLRYLFWTTATQALWCWCPLPASVSTSVFDPVRVRDQRRGRARVRRLPLAADDVRVAARRGELVVVALERAVAREGAVPGVRRCLVDLERRRERRAAVERLLVVGVDHVRVKRGLARLVSFDPAEGIPLKLTVKRRYAAASFLWMPCSFGSTLRKASTTLGSNWRPDWTKISATAVSQRNASR
jgi:hypothetical protein